MNKKRINRFIPKKIKKIFFNEDFIYIFKNSRYNITFQFINLILNFIISICFANFTSREFYGTYLLILNIMMFFSFLNFSGLNTALIQTVSNGYDIILKNMIKKKLVLTSIGAFIIFIFSFYFFIQGEYVIFTCII
ncbi:MAG: oligosaccharide flippase family protein, partial [Promethearchaeia archaeon]